MNSWKIDTSPGTAEALNRLAREEMKLRLMRDIAADIQVCRLEGWEYQSYLVELRELIDGFLKEGKDDIRTVSNSVSSGG